MYLNYSRVGKSCRLQLREKYNMQTPNSPEHMCRIAGVFTGKERPDTEIRKTVTDNLAPIEEF